VTPANRSEIRGITRALRRRWGLPVSPPSADPRDACFAGRVNEPESVSESASPQQKIPPAAEADLTFQEDVQRVLRANSDETRDCYEAGLRSHTGLAGRVVLHLTIEPSGAVSRSAFASTMPGSSKVEACMGRLFCRCVLPTPPGGKAVTVEQAYMLEPEGAAAQP
jgi:hypothetical protein